MAITPCEVEWAYCRSHTPYHRYVDWVNGSQDLHTSWHAYDSVLQYESRLSTRIVGPRSHSVIVLDVIQ